MVGAAEIEPVTEKNELRVPWFRSRVNVALLVFLGIGGYFLFTEHQAHVIQALPFALVLGCVVMHLFMHGGHGHGSEDANHQDDRIESSGDEHER